MIDEKIISCPPVDPDGKRRIDQQAQDYLAECIKNEPNTIDLHTDENGNYTDERQKLHDKIISKFEKSKTCLKQTQPIAIFMGGAPGSGKSTFLKKFAPYMTSDKIYKIDADEVRAELPEYKGWNSKNTHSETRDIVNRLIDNASEGCEHDIIFDGTMTRPTSYIKLIEKVKAKGYRTFIIFLKVPKEVSVERILGRYQSSGRFVPITIVDEFFQTGDQTLKQLEEMVDGYVIVDGVTSEIIEQKGDPIPRDRPYFKAINEYINNNNNPGHNNNPGNNNNSSNNNEQDLWKLGTKFFEIKKEKVLGTPYQASGRFGEVTLYKGDITDLEKIDIPTDWKESQDPDSVTVTQIESDIEKDEPALSPSQLKNINTAIGKSPSDIVKKQKRKAQKQQAIPAEISESQILSFEEILKQYNPQISPEELRVFIWHKWDMGQALSGKWLNIYNPEAEFTDEQLLKWIKDGLVCYVSGELIPSYIYFAENIYDRQDQLERDKPYIIQTYGKPVFDSQQKRLGIFYQDLLDNRLIISENEDDNLRLIIKPISDFAYNYRIKTLVDGKPFKAYRSKAQKTFDEPDFEKTTGKSEYQLDEFTDLSLNEAFIMWMQKNVGTIIFGHGITWFDIFKIYLRQAKRPKDIEPTVYSRKKAQSKSEGDRLFNEFLAIALTPDDRKDIETTWNKQFNSYQQIDYDKVPVAFDVAAFYPGDDPMEIRQEKRDAIAFAFNEGSACLAYGVGVGKTWAAIYIIAQFLEAGYCSKPFLVVPNQTYKQWISEIRGILPHIKINDLYNLSKPYIDALKDEDGIIQPLESGTISIMTYEGFANIGFNETTTEQMIGQLYEILNQGEPGVVETKKKRASFRERLEEIVGKGIVGTTVDIEDLGFDYGCWDEAHAMKKVFTSVKSASKGGKEKRFKNYDIQSGTPSTTALKGFMISQYIARNNNERNVLLLTATPFTNSPLEVFSMLALVAYNKLRETNLNNLNRFFDTYVQVDNELVINAALRPVRKQVFMGFNNLQSLQKLIFRFIDYKEAKNMKRPDKYVIPYKGQVVDGVLIPVSTEETVDSILPLDRGQAAMMEDVRSYVEGKVDLTAICRYDQKSPEDEEPDGIEAATPVEDLNEEDLSKDEKAGVRVLRGVNYARSLALSPYLYECSNLGTPDYKQYIDSSPKLRYVMGCIKSVKAYHKKEGSLMSGQVIYIDRGVELFPLIAQYLVKELGFSKSEVGIISAKMKTPKDVKKKDAKEAVQNRFLGRKFNDDTLRYEDIPDEDRIKVLIGSSSIKEGINLQRYSTVLYNCWLDWNPTDIIQLEGRIWRQGNLFGAVRIVNPLLENSMDAFIFQKLEEKTARINAIFNRDGKTNFLKTEEFSPKELKSELIRDPKALAEIMVDEENERVQDEKASIENNIKIADSVKSMLYTVEAHKDEIEQEVNKYRPKKNGPPRSIKANIATYDRILKEQTDSEGRSFEDPEVKKLYGMQHWETGISASYWYSDFRAAVKNLERQKEVFLDPNGIEASDGGLDFYIKDQQSRLDALTSKMEEFGSEESIDRITQDIIRERKEKKYQPKSVSERIKEFSRLNKLLSDREAIKMITVKPGVASDKQKAAARIRIKIRLLKLQAKD